MRIRWSRRAIVATLFLASHLGFVACSSTDTEDGDLEAVEENNYANGSEEGAEVDGENSSVPNTALNNGQIDEGTNNLANYGNYGNDSMVDSEGAEEYGNNLAGGNSTEGEIQSIISEMNGTNQAVPTENVAAANVPAELGEPAAPVAEASTAEPMASIASSPVVGLPEMGAKMAYVVQQGDTLSKIAGRIYGDMGRWRELADLTGVANPSRIYPGDVIYYALDESSKAFAQTYESLNRGMTTVQSGETLATISKRIFGKHRNWKSIWRQNDNIDDPDNLVPGTTIYFVTQDQLSAALNKASSYKITVNKVQKAGSKVVSKIKGEKVSAKILASVWKNAKPFSMNSVNG